jgi:hypothetical protein
MRIFQIESGPAAENERPQALHVQPERFGEPVTASAGIAVERAR